MLTLALDVGPEDPTAEDSAEPPAGPHEGEEVAAGEESAGDPAAPEEGHEEPAVDSNENPEAPVDVTEDAEPEGDAPADVEEDKGPKEAEFPPIDPGADDADLTGGDTNTADAPVRYFWSYGCFYKMLTCNRKKQHTTQQLKKRRQSPRRNLRTRQRRQLR